MILSIRKFFPRLCNGSTGDFDSPSLGSNPSWGANAEVAQW